MCKIKYILASASPRRKLLLEKAGIEFEVLAADCDESIENGTLPYEACKMLAERKCREVLNKINNNNKNVYVVAADTMVALGSEIFGKPQSYENALEMLMKLSGNVHSVYTGVCIMNDNDNAEIFCEKTDVYMRDFSENEAIEYIKTGEPMDKAGAYAIQGQGAAFIEKIEGDYNNVVGFPQNIIDKMMKKQNI